MAKSTKPPASELDKLLDAERRARERYDRLAGYPDEIREAAHSLWQAASEALGDYRRRAQPKRD
ncbi:hypothetical protein [Reyranella sp.]|uniref:hypothetical protein n=1 Tax=Reyranella sp. TaxID=1929291 RepID=UPI00403683E2